MSLSPDHEHFIALGQAVGGDSWRGKFARMVGLDRSYIALIAKGKRPVTEHVRQAVLAGLSNEINRLRFKAEQFEFIYADYEARELTEDE
jgi:hypothetical protein